MIFHVAFHVIGKFWSVVAAKFQDICVGFYVIRTLASASGFVMKGWQASLQILLIWGWCWCSWVLRGSGTVSTCGHKKYQFLKVRGSLDKFVYRMDLLPFR